MRVRVSHANYIITYVAIEFASMLNMENRGHAFSWQKWLDKVGYRCMIMMPLNFGELNMSHKYSELCEKTAIHFAKRLISEAGFKLLTGDENV